MILSRNIDPRARFAQVHVPLPIRAAASETDLGHGAFIPLWAGEIVSVTIYTSQLTDADNSVTVDLKKNGVSLLATPIDPVAAGDLYELTLLSTSFAAEDEIVVHATTGAGDLFVATLTLVVRPLLGGQELASNASLI